MIFHSNYSKKHIKVLEVGDVFYNGTSTLFWDRERIHNAGTDAVFSIVKKSYIYEAQSNPESPFLQSTQPARKVDVL